MTRVSRNRAERRTSKIDGKERDLRPESRGRELAGLASELEKLGSDRNRGCLLRSRKTESLIRQYGTTYLRCRGGYVLVGEGKSEMSLYGVQYGLSWVTKGALNLEPGGPGTRTSERRGGIVHGSGIVE